jgi:hypothetical protein
MCNVLKKPHFNRFLKSDWLNAGRKTPLSDEEHRFQKVSISQWGRKETPHFCNNIEWFSSRHL